MIAYLRLRETCKGSNLPLEVDIVALHPRFIDQLDRPCCVCAIALGLVFKPDLAEATSAKLLYSIPSCLYLLSEYSPFWVFTIEVMYGVITRDLSLDLACFQFGNFLAVIAKFLGRLGFISVSAQVISIDKM